MASLEETPSDFNSELLTEAHIQHGHPPLEDPSIKYYMKWDEWAESSNIHHQRHRLAQWEVLIEPTIERFYSLDEQGRAGLGFPDIKFPPQPDETASYEKKHEYLVEVFHKALSVALPGMREERVKGSLTKQDTLDKYLAPYNQLRLHDPSTAIRLLEILPGSVNDPSIETRLFVADLETVENQYEGLSYTWGDSNDPSSARKIRVNGVKRRVTYNLYSALHSLRRPKSSRVLWIDSICINQGDLGERMQQVMLMSKIYKLAKQVIVYLGPATAASSAFIKFLNTLDRTELPDDDDITQYPVRTRLQRICRVASVEEHDMLEGFIDISSRSWWSRVWTLQEYVLSKRDPILCCGTEEFSNDVFSSYFEKLWDWVEHNKRHPVPIWSCGHPACEDALPPRPKSGEKGKEIDERDQENADILGEDGDPRAAEESPFPLQGSKGREWVAWGRRIQLANDVMSRRSYCRPWSTPDFMYQRFRSECTDPHDIVYGLRELMEPVFKDLFKPDYTLSVAKLFTKLAAYLTMFDRWTDLFFHYPYRLKTGVYGIADDEEIPSWTPDFTKPMRRRDAERMPKDRRKVTRTVYSNSMIIDKVLFMTGWLVDEIISVYPLPVADPFGVLQQLWYFERRHGGPKYKMIDDFRSGKEENEENEENPNDERDDPYQKMVHESDGITPYPSIAWATQYSETLPADVSLMHIIYHLDDFEALFLDVFKEFAETIAETIDLQLEVEARDLESELGAMAIESLGPMERLAGKGLQARRRRELRDQALNDYHMLFRFLIEHKEDVTGIAVFDYHNVCAQVRYLLTTLDLDEATRLGFLKPRKDDEESGQEVDGVANGRFGRAVTQQPFFYLDLITRIMDGCKENEILTHRHKAVLTLLKRINEKAEKIVGIKGDSLYSTVSILDDAKENEEHDDKGYEIMMVPMTALLLNDRSTGHEPSEDQQSDQVEEVHDDGDEHESPYGSGKHQNEIKYQGKSAEAKDQPDENTSLKKTDISGSPENAETAVDLSADPEPQTSATQPRDPISTKEPHGEWLAWRYVTGAPFDVHLTLTDLVDFLKGRELFKTESGLVGLTCPGAQPLKDGDDVFILEGMTFPLIGRLEHQVVEKLENGDFVKLRRRQMSSVRMRREILGSCVLKDIDTQGGHMDDVVWPEGVEPLSTRGMFRFK